MSEKSHVSMATAICPICGKEEETGEILLHQQIQPVLDRRTCTGFKPCKEHTTDIENGYVFLIATESEKEPMKHLTGVTLRLDQETAQQLFAKNIDTIKHGIVFVEPQVIDWIMSTVNNQEGELHA